MSARTGNGHDALSLVNNVNRRPTLSFRCPYAAVGKVESGRNGLTPTSRRLEMANQNQGGRGGNQGGNQGNRGFAAMDPEKQREIASKGGRAAHESGNAHEFTSEEAREAGRKGGEASRGGGNQGGNR